MNRPILVAALLSLAACGPEVDADPMAGVGDSCPCREELACTALPGVGDVCLRPESAGCPEAATFTKVLLGPDPYMSEPFCTWTCESAAECPPGWICPQAGICLL